MKKTFFIVLLCAVLLLWGCTSGYDTWNEDIFEQYMGSNYHNTTQHAPSENTQKKYIVGYACQDYNIPFAVSVRDEVLKALKNSDMNIELVMYDGESNVEKQLSQIELMVSQRMDMILLNAVSFTACERVLKTARDNNIPVVTVISEVSNQEDCVSFVGPDQYDVGTMQAQALARRMSSGGNIFVLEDTPATAIQIARSRAYRDVLATYPDINMIDIQCAHGKEDEAYIIIRNQLRQEGCDITGVLAQNDSMALGAARAARDNGGQGSLLIVGADGTNTAIDAVETGALLATVSTDAAPLAASVTECVEGILLGNPVDTAYITPSIVIS